ncbi:hypothetical protein K458DRAFT_299890, partial [Lentithecium fluviatile CBS 122367]
GVSGAYWSYDSQSIKMLIGPLPHGAALYDTASVYYSAGYGYWILKGDATAPPCNKRWLSLRFAHDEIEYSSYITNNGSAHTLCCQRFDQQWPQMLFPDIYQTRAVPTHQSHGGLKGDLSLFLALIAFSMSMEDLQQYLSAMCLGGSWQVHGLAHGRK